MCEMYAGPIPVPFLDVDYVFEIVTETIDAWKQSGRRMSRLTVLIPVDVHRLWCTDLVAPPDPTGWPTLGGASIWADQYLIPPDDWKAGDPVFDPSADMVEIWARHIHVPILKRFSIGPGMEAIEPIYVRLRLDGWPIDKAREAAMLLSEGPLCP